MTLGSDYGHARWVLDQGRESERMPMPVIDRGLGGDEMHVPTVTHGDCGTAHSDDEVEMVLKEVSPGEDSMDVSSSDTNGLTGNGGSAVIVPVGASLCELKAAQDLMGVPLHYSCHYDNLPSTSRYADNANGVKLVHRRPALYAWPSGEADQQIDRGAVAENRRRLLYKPPQLADNGC